MKLFLRIYFLLINIVLVEMYACILNIVFKKDIFILKLYPSTEIVYIIILCNFHLQNDVEIPIPKFFINERLESLKEREKLLGQILTKLGPQEKDTVRLRKEQ